MAVKRKELDVHVNETAKGWHYVKGKFAFDTLFYARYINLYPAVT